MALRARRAGGRWGVMSRPRFGRYAGPSPLKSPIWIHAVRLGEARAAQPLVQALVARGEHVLLTHMTAPGRVAGARVFSRAIEQQRFHQHGFHYDFPGSARRFVVLYKTFYGVLYAST